MSTPPDGPDGTLTALIIATLTAVPVLLQGRRFRRSGARERLRGDAELLQLLPKDSQAHARLLAHLDDGISRLVGVDDRRTRDPAGITIALVIVGFGVALIVLGIGASGVLAAVLLTFGGLVAAVGAIGLGLSVPRQLRDERGNAIKGDGRA